MSSAKNTDENKKPQPQIIVRDTKKASQNPCMILDDEEVEKRGAAGAAEAAVQWRTATPKNTIFSTNYVANTLFSYTGRKPVRQPMFVEDEDPPYASVTPPATD
jgi:hypothetical protein